MAPKLDKDGNPIVEPVVTPAAEPAAKPVFGRRVTVNGVEFEVDDALASALSSENAAHQERLSQATKPAPAAAADLTPSADPDEDFNTQFFENPRRALDQLGMQLSDNIIKSIDTRNVKKGQQDTFWKNFYNNHKNLEAHDSIVKLTLNENFAELEKLPIEEAQKKLAEKVSDKVLSLHRDLQPDETTMEPGSVFFDPSGVAPELDDDGPSSLGDVLRERKKARTQKRGE